MSGLHTVHRQPIQMPLIITFNNQTSETHKCSDYFPTATKIGHEMLGLSFLYTLYSQATLSNTEMQSSGINLGSENLQRPKKHSKKYIDTQVEHNLLRVFSVLTQYSIPHSCSPNIHCFSRRIPPHAMCHLHHPYNGSYLYRERKYIFIHSIMIKLDIFECCHPFTFFH